MLEYRASRSFILVCPLCHSKKLSLFSQFIEKSFGQLNERFYYCCSQCQLIFLRPDLRLSADQEEERYKTHQNSADNSGYTQFLSQILTPLQSVISKSDRGLDFGCGPEPVLVQMMQDSDFQMDYFDPLFFPHTEELKQKYDFLTCTEVLEHVFDLKTFLYKMQSLLRENGVFACMTSLYESSIDFKSWPYRKDDTHVCFFQQETMVFIQKMLNWNLIYQSANKVFIFKNDSL